MRGLLRRLFPTEGPTFCCISDNTSPPPPPSHPHTTDLKMELRRINGAVFEYMEKMTSELIIESGNPEDRYHLGKLLLKAMREHPDAINQIDGATGDSETNASVLERSTRLASAFRRYGVRTGDVVALLAPNHIDLCIPFYASFYLGAINMAVDRTLGLKELVEMFDVGKPKLVFCQSEKADQIQLALNQLELSAEVLTFDAGDYMSTSLDKFLELHGDEDFDVDTFQADEFNGAETTALIISTSGTTGLPKAAAVSHKNLCITGPYIWCTRTQFPTPTTMAMVCSPLQWLTALITYLWSAVLTYTRLQSSAVMDQKHCYDLIKKYRPTWTVLSPTMMTTLLKTSDRLNCDFGCFETIWIGGSAVPKELIQLLKTLTTAEVNDIFGMSEMAGTGFSHDGNTPLGSCGRPVGCLQYRLMDLSTQEEIVEPFRQGELWLSGLGIFTGYYNNPEATEETFAKSDGRWFKTGDMFYRDYAHNYYYVDRIKLMLKYKSYQISPVEVENVIRACPLVADVAVTAVPDPECGDLLVACVVRENGSRLTAHQVKELVKENLSESKHLHGGVIFMNELPLTASTKIHRRKLKEIAANSPRE